MRSHIVSTSVVFLLISYTVKAFPVDTYHHSGEREIEEGIHDDNEDLKIIASYLHKENQKYLETHKDTEFQKYIDSPKDEDNKKDLEYHKFGENQNNIENKIEKINKHYIENQKDSEDEVNLFDIRSGEDTEKQKYMVNEKNHRNITEDTKEIKKQNATIINNNNGSKGNQTNKENQKEVTKQIDIENNKDKDSKENQNNRVNQKEIEKLNNTENKIDQRNKENQTYSDNKKEIEKQNHEQNKNVTKIKLGEINVTDVNSAIEFLKKEQSDVYQQINEAIEESVKALQSTNDTYAQEGISYVKELKGQINELNFTGNIEDVQYNLKDIQDYFSRRMGYNKSEDIEDRRQLKYDEFEEKEFRLENLFGKPHDSDKWLGRYQNRLLVQDQINNWAIEREEEKHRIKEYHEQHAHTLKPERCPREGRIKQKKEKKKPNQPKKQAKVKHAGVYPCCRKCCKRSDMGCL